MDIVGIICEYNPFHNGHIYHINKAKELFPNSLVILVLSGPFTQRGDVSLLSKWEKAKIALNHKIDLIVELPFKYASQSADIFAKGSIEILNKLKCEKLVFGSETADLKSLENLAKMQIEDKNYNLLVKSFLDSGLNYPSAMSKAFEETVNIKVDQPNDILALAYIKEIIKQNSKIEAFAIKRTNSYHSDALDNKIASASAIRKAMKNNEDIKNYVPGDTYQLLKNKREKDLFELLKYKVLTEDNLDKYQTVDEGIDNRIKSVIENSKDLEEFISKVKTKRYTYSRIKRMIMHIIISFTKEDAQNLDLNYIRVLAFNKNGKKHLSKIKKDLDIALISNIKKQYDEILSLDNKAEKIYQFLQQEKIDTYKNAPIYKQD